MFSKLNEKINYYYKEKKDDLMFVTLFITIPLFLYIFLPTLFEILGIFYPIIIFILESRRSNKRYEEAQRDANNLRLKELEQREDFYRPIFVTTNNGIKLIMKKKNLVIENINFFSDATGRIYKQIMKTDDVISFENTPVESTGVAFPNEFFIFADTMLGERIVFGYFFGGQKIYKCLKEDGDFLMPRGSNMEDYTIAKINKEWKSYNTNRTNWPIEIEKYFFYSTQFYREKMYIPENILKSLLATSNTKNIFEEIFERLLKYHKEYLFTRDSIINVLELYFEFVKSNSMEFDLNYDGINFNFINKKEYGIKDCLLTNKPIFSQDMDLNIVSSYEKIIELIRNGEIRDRYGLIEFSLYTLIELFKNTKISPQINNRLILKKYDLINILEFENYIFKDYLKSFE